jgi:hypothetical protein
MTDYGDRALQKRIRLGFFDQYGSQEPLKSVAVRRDAGRDEWFLDVGLTGAPTALPKVYEGLTIREQQVGRARHAVLLPDSTR